MDDNGVTGTLPACPITTLTCWRDGIDASASARFMQAGIQTATMLNPDLVGELRLIVAPVDAEMGRGNGQMIVQTRSGTINSEVPPYGRFRNSALDANTWKTTERSIRKPVAGVLRHWIGTTGTKYTLSAGGPSSEQNVFLRVVGWPDQ